MPGGSKFAQAKRFFELLTQNPDLTKVLKQVVNSPADYARMKLLMDSMDGDIFKGVVAGLRSAALDGIDDVARVRAVAEVLDIFTRPIKNIPWIPNGNGNWLVDMKLMYSTTRELFEGLPSAGRELAVRKLVTMIAKSASDKPLDASSLVRFFGDAPSGMWTRWPFANMVDDLESVAHVKGFTRTLQSPLSLPYVAKWGAYQELYAGARLAKNPMIPELPELEVVEFRAILNNAYGKTDIDILTRTKDTGELIQWQGKASTTSFAGGGERLLKKSPDDWFESALKSAKRWKKIAAGHDSTATQKWVYSGGDEFDVFNKLTIHIVDKLGGKVVHIPWFGS